MEGSQTSLGSFSYPFKLGIIGGGPSGCSIIVRAIRIGLINQLCSGDESQGVAGVLLIDQDSPQRLGGGRLQDYIINSNTFVSKFVVNVVEERPENLPAERTSGSILASLAHTPTAKELLQIANHTGSLQKSGKFLCEVGQAVLETVSQYPASQVRTQTTVTQMQQVNDEKGSFYAWKLTVTSSASCKTDELYVKYVALATGGHQSMPRLSNPLHQAKVMLSDDVCTALGSQRLKSLVNKANNNGTRSVGESPGRVVIVGGSHSAFSAAWVCLQGMKEEPPISHLTSSMGKQLYRGPHAEVKSDANCIFILHRSPIRVFYNSMVEAELDGYRDVKGFINKVTGQINQFAGLRGDSKELWRRIRSHREHRVRLISVQKTAMAVDSSSMNASNDATEAHAKVAAMKQAVVHRMFDKASVIIWACGYETNLLPMLDCDGQPIKLMMTKGQVVVDNQARVLRLDNDEKSSPSMVVPNLFGSGLGYGLSATFEDGSWDGSSGRADGVAVYMKRGATLVLFHVLGDVVFGGRGIQSWEERTAFLRRQKYAGYLLTTNSTGPSNANNRNSHENGGIELALVTVNSDKATRSGGKASDEPQTSPLRTCLTASHSALLPDHQESNPKPTTPQVSNQDSPLPLRPRSNSHHAVLSPSIKSIEFNADSAVATRGIFVGRMRADLQLAGALALQTNSSNDIILNSSPSRTEDVADNLATHSELRYYCKT